jgi:gluconokinase
VRIEDVVEPDEDEAATYARVLPTFAGLYDALEPAFRALQTLAEHEAPGDASGEESS